MGRIPKPSAVTGLGLHKPILMMEDTWTMLDLKPMQCQDCGWLGNKAELVRINFTMGDPQFCCPACGGDRITEERPAETADQGTRTERTA